MISFLIDIIKLLCEQGQMYSSKIKKQMYFITVWACQKLLKLCAMSFIITKQFKISTKLTEYKYFLRLPFVFALIYAMDARPNHKFVFHTVSM